MLKYDVMLYFIDHFNYDIHDVLTHKIKHNFDDFPALNNDQKK